MSEKHEPGPAPIDPTDSLEPITDEERAEAEALRRLLAGESDATSEGASHDRAAIGLVRVAAGREPPLGDLRARGVVRDAMKRAADRRGARTVRFRRVVGVMAALAAALVLAVTARSLSPESLPDRLCSRSAGQLVPGPFPPSETPADRLDRVTEDRMVALRELRLRKLSGGRR